MLLLNKTTAGAPMKLLTNKLQHQSKEGRGKLQWKSHCHCDTVLDSTRKNISLFFTRLCATLENYSPISVGNQNPTYYIITLRGNHNPTYYVITLRLVSRCIGVYFTRGACLCARGVSWQEDAGRSRTLLNVEDTRKPRHFCVLCF